MWVALIASASALESVSRLLLQRSLQTQVCYMMEFHDEPKAQWLANYGDPAASLEAEFLSDRDLRPKFHGLDAICDSVDAVDYLGLMMEDEPVRYKVSCAVGYSPPPDRTSGGSPDGFAQTALSGMAMWGQDPAIASRRRNPYLGERQVKYFDETIEPKDVAKMIMRTREHLADEWGLDLQCLLNKYETNDERVWIDDKGDSSPLRYLNIDLLDRLATREATESLSNELNQAESKFLRSRLEPEDDEDPLEEGLEPEVEFYRMQCRLMRRDALGDHTSEQGQANRWLDAVRNTPAFTDKSFGAKVKPRKLADEIAAARNEILAQWSASLRDRVTEEHAAVNYSPSEVKEKVSSKVTL